jgi:hypothetical protein
MKTYRNQKGSLLIVVLIGLIVLTVMGVAFLGKSHSDLLISGFSQKKTDSYYIAESAVNMIALNLKNMLTMNIPLDFVRDEPKIYDPTDPATDDYKDWKPETYEYVKNWKPGSTCDWNANFNDCFNQTANGCFLDLWNSGLPGMDLGSMIRTMYYLVPKYILALGFENFAAVEDPTKRYDVRIREMSVSTDLAEKRTLQENLTIPNEMDLMQYASLATERRILHFVVEAKSQTSNSSSTVEAKIIVYGIPLFQWLMLSEKNLTFVPGSLFVLSGRVHTNQNFRAATIGGPIQISPYLNNHATDLTKALTTSGSIFQIFRITTTGGNDWDYKSSAGNKLVEVETDWDQNTNVSTYERFHDHLINGSYPSSASCSNDPDDPECWVDSNLNGYTYYSVKVDSMDADFKGRTASGVDPIHPNWFSLLNPEDPKNAAQVAAGTFPYKVSDILQPGNAMTDDSTLQHTRKWYKASLRIVQEPDGTLRSVDIMNNDIADPLNPLHINNLKAKGLVSFNSSNFFYMPTAGRVAKPITLDVGVLQSDPTLKNLNIDHVYVGSSINTQGSIQFPGPSCIGKLNAGLSAICVNEDGTPCTANCATTPVGEIRTLMLTNGQKISDKGLTISTNLTALVKGDYNTTPMDEAKPLNTDANAKDPITKASLYNPLRPAALLCDNIAFLSNDWDPSKWYHPITNPTGTYGWDPDESKGPPPVTKKATYNLAYMTSYNGSNTGAELPLMEKWNGNVLDRSTSAVMIYPSTHWPPRAGGTVFNDWYHRAWAFFFGPATWRTSQITSYGQTPPPDTDKTIAVIIQSIREIETGPFI